MSTQWTKGWGFLASKVNLSNMEEPFNSGSLAENLSFLRISNLAGLLYLSNVAGSSQNWSASSIKIETVGPPAKCCFVVYGEVSDVKWLIISHHDCKVSWSWITMNPMCNIKQLSRNTYEDDWRCVSSQFSPSLTKAEPPFANDWMSLDPLSVHTAFFTASSSACFRAFQWLSLPLCRTRKNDSTISFKHLPKTSEEKHLSNRATALTSKSYTSKIRDFLISETCWTPNPTIFQHHPRLSTAFCSARISAASPSWVPEVSP